jgi:hypothetical protein
MLMLRRLRCRTSSKQTLFSRKTTRPFNPMLLAGRRIMHWPAMIAILVAQNAQGNVQDKQVEHLHDLGVTTHTLVVEM